MNRRVSAGLCVAILSIVINHVDCIGYYTIVAPESIRPHSDYQVSVTLHNEFEPATMRLAIEDGLQYKNGRTVTIASNRTELVTLHIDALDVTKGYKFVAEGLSGLRFRNESQLRIQSKNVSIFIQTDKAIYKPAEAIKFRVLVLDARLRPAALAAGEQLSIYVTDSEKNRIRQWVNVTMTKGVFAGEIQLSEQPVLGDWTISTRIGNEKKSKIVEIAEYVLPKFDVSIDAPAELSAKDGKIRAIIRSKYTYGKHVKGDAIVSLTPSETVSYYGYASSQAADSVLKTAKIDGKGSVEFSVDDDLRLDFSENKRDRYYQLRATVIEELTGQNQSVTKDITIHASRYNVEASALSHDFNPGLPLTFSLGVRHHDGSSVLLNDDTKWITIGKILSPYTANERVTYEKYELGSNGTAEVRLPTSAKDTHFNVEVKYMGETTGLGYFYPIAVAEDAELEAKILTKRPTLNQDVFVEVQSNKEMQNFTYQIIGHGKVIYAGNVAVPDRKYHVFKFRATFDLAPKATLIVYRFKHGDIVAAKTEIPIDDDLSNFVRLKLSKAEARPGGDVAIDIVTNAGSYVGLVGVDQSVLLLKKNADLGKDEAFQEMNEYQERFHDANDGPWHVSPRPYTNEHFAVFERSQVIMFTNARQNVHRFNTRVYAQPILHKEAVVQYGLALGAPEMSVFDSEISEQEPSPAPPRVRTEFPETWLWEMVDVNSSGNGTLTLSKNVPDTITSWVISGFSINPDKGLGLTHTPKTLKVYQPFFISLNLPYSVKRGEIVALPVILFNYLSVDVDAELTVHNDGQFEFVDDDESDDRLANRARTVAVSSNNGVASMFLLKFTSAGGIHIRVTATTPIAGDAVERILRVEPEGIAQYVNKPIFVDLREAAAFEASESVEVPATAVPDSLRVNVNAIGDLLGGTMHNLHTLIRLPTGCGEQNMLKFVPNIVILDYLRAANSLQPDIEAKANKYLIAGYQRELTYRHRNGSFSAFGKSDRSGSTWLTAFVAKSFKQADKYIDVDRLVIGSALDWLSAVQAADGSFPEVGQISHEAMQGGADKGIALTAYTAIAFLANKVAGEWQHQPAVDKAVANIAANIDGVQNPYAYAIAAYALQLADHPAKDEALDNLLALASSAGQLKWWTRKSANPAGQQSKSINIEITAYGLLSMIHADRLPEALPYFRWLLKQRNDQGGFVGTQDTVVGLDALAQYAKHLATRSNSVQMQIAAEPANETFVHVNADNALVLQTIELPSGTETVRLTATGHGFALVQLSYRYNVNESDAYSTFTLHPTVGQITAGHLSVDICSTFHNKSATERHSNMAVLEVAMPSGFIVDRDKLAGLLRLPHIKLVETKRGETQANVYIDQMTAEQELCVTVQGYRSHQVAETKPVAVKIYDYYDSSRSAQQFYGIPLITSCEICNGQCGKLCKQ